MAEQAKYIGETSPNFRKIVVDGFLGNIESIGLDMQVYSSQKLLDRALELPSIEVPLTVFKRTVECELILSPLQLKATAEWLQEKVEEYEAIFGRILTQEEADSKFNSYHADKEANKPSKNGGIA